MARVASSTTTSRRGSTRPAILRNPSRLMRAPPAPPQANGGMYLGGRTSSKTFAPVPITVPVPSRGPIADARTGPPSTWAFAPTHRGPSSRAPARTSAPLSSTTGPFRTSKTTPGSTAASCSAIAAGSPSTALPGGSGSLSPSKARRSSGSSCSSAGTRSYTPRSTRRGEGERRSQPSPRRRTSPTARGSGARRPAARTTGVLRRTVPTRGRGPDRAGRGRGSQPLHELLQALGAAGGHHERVAVGPHDHHIFQADHGNVLALGPDHRAAHVVRHRRLSDHHVAVRVRLANAQQGVPGADVVPAKRPGNDSEPFGPLPHGHVHRHGPDGGEEARDVARRERGPAGLELARVGARFAQEAGHAPGEQPRVPERALAAQQGRAGGGGLLEEAPHGARSAH